MTKGVGHSLVVILAGAANHPFGAICIGGPVTSRLAFDKIAGLWPADAGVMPPVTSANTNAPSMMIGHRAGAMIAEDAA